MAQLSLFADQNYKKEQTPVQWELFVDGAARNNPGPAGAGICIRKDGKNDLQKGYFLGSRTNNEAEYLALLIGLILVCEKMNGNDTLKIYSDSELLVKQITGVYRVKKPELQTIYRVVMGYLGTVTYSIQHVLREKNKVADKLANQGVDTKNPVPAYVEKKFPL